MSPENNCLPPVASTESLLQVPVTWRITITSNHCMQYVGSTLTASECYSQAGALGNVIKTALGNT